MRSRPSIAVLLVAAFLAAAAGLADPACAADPHPAKVVTAADVAAVLGGKWTSTVPEPGVVFYEEKGTGYRSVQVYLFPANGKTVEGMKSQWEQEGEPIEELAGGRALYRPQRREAVTGKSDAAGNDWWLAVVVQNAASDADAKKFAASLLERGAARL